MSGSFKISLVVFFLLVMKFSITAEAGEKFKIFYVADPMRNGAFQGLDELRNDCPIFKKS